MTYELDNEGFLEAMAASGPSIRMRKWQAAVVLDGIVDWHDAAEIMHLDPGFAAEEFAEQLNDGGPPRNRRIAVRPAEGGEMRVFDVDFEVSVSYWAHESKPDSA